MDTQNQTTDSNTINNDETKNYPPLRRLKMQPLQILEFAYEAGDIHCVADAIDLIGRHTGIYLGDASTYSKFRKWFKQQQMLEDAKDVVDQFQMFAEKDHLKVSPQQVRSTTLMLLIQRSYAAGNDELMMRLVGELRKFEELLLARERFEANEKSELQRALQWFADRLDTVDEEWREEAVDLYDRLRDIMLGRAQRETQEVDETEEEVVDEVEGEVEALEEEGREGQFEL